MMVVQVGQVKVPALGLGTWQLRGQECVTAVREALSMGYRHIDTAQMYANEAEVGQAIRDAGRDSGVKREEVWLTTKVADYLDKQRLVPSVDDSLRQLQTDYVDLLLIHWPDDNVPLAETLGEMQKLQRAGKAKYIGVSNFSTAQMAEARRLTGNGIVCNQVEYHPFLNQDKVLAACREAGMFLTAYCPLARGLATENAVIHKIAAEHGKTAAQITLRWLIQQPGVCAIPKSSHPQRLKENLGIFDFELSETEIGDIARLLGRKRLVLANAGHWDSLD